MNLRIWDELDPRARILIVTVATLIAASTAPAQAALFALYLPLILLLITTSRNASWSYILNRCLVSSPFILMASVLLLFQYDLTPDGRPGGVIPAAVVAAKGYTAALLLSFLTASTPLSKLLWAMRKLGSPHALNLILSMMYRYSSLLSEEWIRLERARDSRTVIPLHGMRLCRMYGTQVGTLLVRSWDRAERVHAAMLSRGFDGSWPVLESPHFGIRDRLFTVGILGCFAAARFSQ